MLVWVVLIIKRVTKIKIESAEDESLLGKSGYEFVELKSNK